MNLFSPLFSLMLYIAFILAFTQVSFAESEYGVTDFGREAEEQLFENFDREAEKQLFEIRMYFEKYKCFRARSEEFQSRKDLTNSLQHVEKLLEHTEKQFKMYQELEKLSEAVVFNVGKLREVKKRELNVGIALLWFNLAVIDGQYTHLLMMDRVVSRGLLNGT